MLVILATIIAAIWYVFDLPNVTPVLLFCGLLITFYALIKKVVSSVLFFFGSIILFIWAMSNSLLYGFIAFLGVLFAGAVLVVASKQQGSNKNSNEDNTNDYDYEEDDEDERRRKPKRRAKDDGYHDYVNESNRKASGFTQSNKKSKYDESEEEYRKRKAEDDAYFYRQRGGFRNKVDEADDILGRNQRERDYNDEKYEARYRGCNEPESHCKCCDTCDQYPCRCCRECDDYPCKCCRKCSSYPCECCDECGEANCRCCRRCDSYPCECCDECGQPERYCRCCRKCNSYPCECCNSCGQPDKYCRCG